MQILKIKTKTTYSGKKKMHVDPSEKAILKYNCYEGLDSKIF